jgi:hypothetical protein
LSFVRHIKRTLGNNIFKKRIYKINTELIVFIPDNNNDLFKSLEAEQPHPVTFFVPI